MEVALLAVAATAGVGLVVLVADPECDSCNDRRKDDRPKKVRSQVRDHDTNIAEQEADRMLQLALLQSVELEQARADRVEAEQMQHALQLSMKVQEVAPPSPSSRYTLECDTAASSSQSGNQLTVDVGQPRTMIGKGDALEDYELQMVMELSRTEDVQHDPLSGEAPPK